MKKVGIALIVLQIIVTAISISNGTYSLFSFNGSSWFALYSYFAVNFGFHLCGMIGVVLLIIANRRNAKDGPKVKRNGID